MHSFRNRPFPAIPAKCLVLFAAATLVPACKSTQAPPPVDPPAITGDTAVMDISRMVHRRRALAAEIAPPARLESQLRSDVAAMRQTIRNGPATPYVCAKYADVLLEFPPIPAWLEEAERHYRMAVTKPSGSADFIPGYLGVARIATMQAAGDGARVEGTNRARAQISEASKSYQRLYANYEAGGSTIEFSSTIAELDAYESQPVAPIVCSDEMLAWTSRAQERGGPASAVRVLERMLGRIRLAEAELALVERWWRGTPTVEDVERAYAPVFLADRNFHEARVRKVDQLRKVFLANRSVDALSVMQGELRGLLQLELAQQGNLADPELLARMAECNCFFAAEWIQKHPAGTSAPSEAEAAMQRVADSQMEVFLVAAERRARKGRVEPDLLELNGWWNMLASQFTGDPSFIAKADAELAEARKFRQPGPAAMEAERLLAAIRARSGPAAGGNHP